MMTTTTGLATSSAPGFRGRLDVDAAATQWTSTNRARLGVDCRAGAGTGSLNPAPSEIDGCEPPLAGSDDYPSLRRETV